MIVGGQTEARAQLSSTIIDYHEPFDQGFKAEEHLNLSKSGFVSEEDHSGCKSQNIAVRALKGIVLCQWFKWTY